MCRPVYCSGLGATTIGAEASLQCQCHVDVVCLEKEYRLRDITDWRTTQVGLSISACFRLRQPFECSTDPFSEAFQVFISTACLASQVFMGDIQGGHDG